LKQLFRFVAVLGILAVPAAAHAQISGGVRAGVNLADLAFDPSPPVDSKNLAGLVAGAFITVPLTDMVAFQPEALFSMQGSKFSEQGMTIKTKIDYLQVPLLGRFRVAKGSPLAVLAGPSLGFKTHASFEGPGIPDEFGDEFEDSVKGFDAGLVAGAALDIGHFVVDGRYTWGLTNLAKDPSGSGDPGGSAKNRVFSFSAGVRF
jgi:Outer membrane protein beta-barrel domain